MISPHLANAPRLGSAFVRFPYSSLPYVRRVGDALARKVKCPPFIMIQAKPLNDRIGNAASKLEDLADNAKSVASNKLDDAKSFASDAGDSARSKLDDARSFASDAADSARHRLENAREQVGELASRAADGAGRLGRRARGGVVNVGESVADLVRERPFVALGVAVLVGAGIVAIVRRVRA